MKQTGWRTIALHQNMPGGWLRAFLVKQRDGLTGHLEHAGYPFNTKAWRSDRLRVNERCLADWWPYEQTAYWIDGMMRSGLLLNDSFLKQKARKQIDYVLSRPDRDGYLGPSSIKSLRGERSADRWPHAVFFRSVLADYDERPSRATLRKLTRHYLSNTARHETVRNVCNVEIMAWLYGQTGDPRLKELAEKSYLAFQRNESKSGATLKHMLQDDMARDHGPTYMELFKLGAILYRITGKSRYLKASINAQRKLERDHVLVDGVPSATEHLRGIYSHAGHETCVITDYLWSLGYLLQATGNAKYADAMEVACFNALPGAVTSDFKALQYFSGPNQVVAGPQSNHHPHGIGGAHVSYRPNPATECCPGNVHRALPAFTGNMWCQDGEDGIVAALYGPGSATFFTGNNTVVVSQSSDYPFEPGVEFTFACRRARCLRFAMRIPGWCSSATWWVNGEKQGSLKQPGTYVWIHRMFKSGDRIKVVFNQRVRAVRGPEKSLALRWGPLVFSLPIPASRAVDQKDQRSSQEFPAWTLKPRGPWNYGICRSDLAGARLQVRMDKSQEDPWSAAHAPVCIEVPAHRIPGWQIIRRKKMVLKWGDRKKVVEGDLVFTPALPSDRARAKATRRLVYMRLVPLGATQLRITWFPELPLFAASGTTK